MSEYSARDGLVLLRSRELSAADVDAMAKAIESARTQGAPGVIVDCSGVEQAADGGLLALVRWASLASPRASGIVFAGAKGHLLLAICQTRLQREFDCYSSVDAARAAIGG